MSEEINGIKQFDLSFKRGDTENRTLYFTDQYGAAEDITGWTVFFTVKEKVDDPDAQAKISKTITDHIDPKNGETVIDCSPTDTNLIGNFVYDIQIKKANGEIKTILEGSIVFSKDITQRIV